MNLEFIELELDWPPELTVYDLKEYILSKIINYGVPLRWAITSTSLKSNAGLATQKISIEAVLIINENKKNINTNLN